MNAATTFVTIVSLLLALAAAGGTTEPQADLTNRKAGKGQQEASLVTPSKLATNHNETLVSDTSPQQADALSRLLSGVQSVAFAKSFFYAIGGSCPPFACGSESNHNETLVRDTEPAR